ncbi:MAG TPA: NAD(P)-dependent oxidoreductase [Natronosporangium sp.]|nr:NAD(P)-dependent oxidoreductase [Natronosporangium sp.]
MTVALVGTGRMGAAMAARLAGAGHEVVLYNRTRQRAAQVAAETGARVVDTAAEAAGSADVVLVSLADDAAVEAVYRGGSGLAAGVRDGTVVLEMSTVAPATVRAVEPLVTAAGGTLLDAPVSGSVPVVQRGELTIMVGGDPAALDRARPVLAAFARQVFHLGALGAGATVKLAVNSIVHALNQAVAEALVLAEKAGVDRAKAYEVFANSAAAAPFVLYKQQAFLHPETTPPAFLLDLAAKDLELITALAAEVGARMDLTEAGRRLMDEARAAGLGRSDMSVLAEYLRRQPGTEAGR